MRSSIHLTYTSCFVRWNNACISSLIERVCYRWCKFMQPMDKKNDTKCFHTTFLFATTFVIMHVDVFLTIILLFRFFDDVVNSSYIALCVIFYGWMRMRIFLFRCAAFSAASFEDIFCLEIVSKRSPKRRVKRFFSVCFETKKKKITNEALSTWYLLV